MRIARLATDRTRPCPYIWVWRSRSYETLAHYRRRKQMRALHTIVRASCVTCRRELLSSAPPLTFFICQSCEPCD